MKNFTKFTYHLQFDPQYDDTPVVRVYENYLNDDDDLETDFDQIVDWCEFTNDDVDFALAILGYEGIEDLWIDEYFNASEFVSKKWVQPVVTKWVEDHYEAWVAAYIKEVAA